MQLPDYNIIMCLFKTMRFLLTRKLTNTTNTFTRCGGVFLQNQVILSFKIAWILLLGLQRVFNRIVVTSIQAPVYEDAEARVLSFVK